MRGDFDHLGIVGEVRLSLRVFSLSSLFSRLSKTLPYFIDPPEVPEAICDLAIEDNFEVVMVDGIQNYDDSTSERHSASERKDLIILYLACTMSRNDSYFSAKTTLKQKTTVYGALPSDCRLSFRFKYI